MAGTTLILLIGGGVRVGRILEWKGNVDTTFKDIKTSLKELTKTTNALLVQASPDLMEGMSPMKLTQKGRKLASKMPEEQIKAIASAFSKTFSQTLFPDGSTDRQAEIFEINSFLLAMPRSKGKLPELINPTMAKISNEEGIPIASLCMVIAFRVHDRVVMESLINPLANLGRPNPSLLDSADSPDLP